MSTESNEPTPTTPEARGVEFETIEPWPEPVDGDELLFELSAEIRRYVFLPNEAVIAAALWVPHTYVFETAHVSPILAIVSPVQRCGKSTLLTLLDALSHRSLMAANITPAVLFRTVEMYRPTILVDEFDTQAGRSTELRNLLNAGYGSRGRVLRADGPSRKPRLLGLLS